MVFENMMNICTGRFTITRARSEKISFFVYLLHLLACATLWGILLVWGILNQLVESGVIDQDEFYGIFKDFNVIFHLSTIRIDVGDVSAIFLVVFATMLETISVFGICGAIRVNRRRRIRDDSPDIFVEPKTSLCSIIFLRIVIVICLALGGMSLAVSDPLMSHMVSAMSSVITGSIGSTNIKAMDIYQSVFQCCGAKSPKDWIQVDKENGIVYDWIPQSCCINSSDCSISPRNVILDVSSTAISMTTANPGMGTSIPFSLGNDATFDFVQTQIYDRGCDTAIQSFLTLHSLLLFASAFILILLHTSWVIWRRNAGLPYLCCEFNRRKNRVLPIHLEVNGSPTSSNESLFFLQNKLINNISSSESFQLINVPESSESNHIVMKKPGPPSITRVGQDIAISPLENLRSSFTNKDETKYRPRTSRARPKTGISRSAGNLPRNVSRMLEETMSGHRPPTPAKLPQQVMVVHGDNEDADTFEPAHFSGPASSKDTWATAVNVEVPNTKRQNDDDKLSIYSIDSLEGW
ncbi:uncharacterized protein LOC120339549 [Styela clava]